MGFRGKVAVNLIEEVLYFRNYALVFFSSVVYLNTPDVLASDVHLLSAP